MTAENSIIVDIIATLGSECTEKIETKQFCDFYADYQDTPLVQLLRWVICKYVSAHLIKIFVELLTRIEAPMQDMNFKKNRNLVSELLKFIPEYLSFLPNGRYDLIKHFYYKQTTKGVNVRASMLHGILNSSHLTSKMQRVIEHMNTK